MAIQTLPQNDLFERIKLACPLHGNDRPPFTLILGSGFSVPLIPSTSQLVREDLPWWTWCQKHEAGGPTRDDFLQRNESKFTAAAADRAKQFWQDVLEYQSRQPADPNRKPFLLGPDGLPTKETASDAYQFTLSSVCTPGLHTEHLVRKYFGDLVLRVGRRLNAAHVFLASLVAERPRLFGITFTTNFDPLLQRSLQLFNAPYFVSDRPDTLQAPQDDPVAEGIHLVHAHGSVYRYILASSQADIDDLADRNHSLLTNYFRDHAVLIIGYSGWRDSIIRALKNVDRFHHGLYWCDRGADPANSGLSKEAKEVLEKHGAKYVPIQGADDLMVQMHLHVVGKRLPRLFREPIRFAREQLDYCDLTGVKLPRASAPPAPPAAGGSGKTTSAGTSAAADPQDLGDEVAAIKADLHRAEAIFAGESHRDITAALSATVRKRFRVASDLYFGLRGCVISNFSSVQTESAPSNLTHGDG
jgi:hypothetical protein